jgi:hypothetical protein
MDSLEPDLFESKISLGGLLDINPTGFQDGDLLQTINDIRCQFIANQTIKIPPELTIDLISSPVLTDYYHQQQNQILYLKDWILHKLTLNFYLLSNKIPVRLLFEIALNVDDTQILRTILTGDTTKLPIYDWCLLAIEQSNIQVLQELINKIKNPIVNDLLMYASDHGKLDVIKFLQSKYRPKIDGCRLQNTVRNGHLNTLGYMLYKYPHSLTKDLIEIALKNQHLHIVKFLLHQGSMIDFRDDKLLNYLVSNKKIGSVKFWLKRYKVYFEYTLHYAAISGDSEMYYYIKSKCPISKICFNTIDVCYQHKSPFLPELLTMNIEVEDDEMQIVNRCLTEAIQKDQVELVGFLLDNQNKNNVLCSIECDNFYLKYYKQILQKNIKYEFWTRFIEVYAADAIVADRFEIMKLICPKLRYIYFDNHKIFIVALCNKKMETVKYLNDTYDFITRSFDREDGKYHYIRYVEACIGSNNLEGLKYVLQYIKLTNSQLEDLPEARGECKTLLEFIKK